MLFGREHAAIYDLVYTERGKDYADEARQLNVLVRERRPDAVSLLDVACGTGSHLAALRPLFDRVEGAELAEAMLDVARRKLPGTVLSSADMRDFDLGRRFDAVTCLYSSIAYLDESDVAKAIASMARHLNPGGVLVVEPWWHPEQATDNQIRTDVITGEGLTVSRMSHGRIIGGAHHLECHFLVSDGTEVRSFTDTQVLGVYPRELYVNAFEAAGLEVEVLREGLAGRGVYVGVLGRD